MKNFIFGLTLLASTVLPQMASGAHSIPNHTQEPSCTFHKEGSSLYFSPETGEQTSMQKLLPASPPGLMRVEYVPFHAAMTVAAFLAGTLIGLDGGPLVLVGGAVGVAGYWYLVYEDTQNKRDTEALENQEILSSYQQAKAQAKAITRNPYIVGAVVEERFQTLVRQASDYNVGSRAGELLRAINESENKMRVHNHLAAVSMQDTVNEVLRTHQWMKRCGYHFALEGSPSNETIAVMPTI